MEKNVRDRTKQFALRIIRLYSALSPRGATLLLQLLPDTLFDPLYSCNWKRV